MGDEVEVYVKSCLLCQHYKTERRKEIVLFQALPVLEQPWQSISMDFILGFPKVDRFKSIMMVMDR